MTWDEFLQSLGCYKDAVGNRPCDNGDYCDKCSQSWALEEYEKVRKKG